MPLDEDVGKLIQAGRKSGQDGHDRAAVDAFAKAVKLAARTAATGTVDGQLALSSDLRDIADAQARVGLWRPAQRTFAAARKAAKKAPDVVTRHFERAEAIDEVGEAEVVAMMAAAQPRAARGAAKQIGEAKVRIKAWLNAGAGGAKAGALDHAHTAFAEARVLAADMPDDGSRDFWLDEVGRLETKAMAKAARSRTKGKGGSKARELSETAKLAEKAADGDSKALRAMTETVHSGPPDDARLAARALAEACFLDDVDSTLTMPGLLEAFTHREADIREIAAGALESLMLIGSIQGFPAGAKTDDVGPRLAARLTDSLPKIRILVANSIGWLGDAEAVPALIRALKPPGLISRLLSKDSFGESRAAAARALGRLGEGAADAVDRLIKSTGSDPFPEVRRAAMEALDQIGDTRALPVAAAQLDDPVTGYAARSLVINFRQRGLVDEQQMALLRHGLADEAFED